MSIKVQCEKCGSVLKIKEELAGTKGKCPKCKNAFRVPTIGESDAAMPVAVATESAAAESPDAGRPAAATEQTESPADSAEMATSAESESSAEAVAASPPPPDQAAPAAESPAETPSQPPETNGQPAGSQREAVAESKTPAPPTKSPPPADEEFDPVAFMMAEGGPKPKAAIPKPAGGAPPGAKRGLTPKSPPGRRLELSDEETSVPQMQDTAPPPSRAGVRTAADTANAMLSGNATAASAKDLLSRTAQDSRSRASQMPGEESQYRIDYLAAFKELGRAFGPHIAGTIVLCAGIYLFMSHMLATKLELPQLAPVYGKLTLAGQPLGGVTICFTPVGDRNGESANGKIVRQPRDSTAITEPDGTFELMYLPVERIKGAVVGKNRVWIQPIEMEDYKKVPGQYQNANTSNKIRDVTPSGGEINIDL